ncbi:MAG TPA: hypothetical protein PLE92_04310 [Lentisphaeria bacterium]|nr:hypothetical protein [Lentisphaeria bacterium]
MSLNAAGVCVLSMNGEVGLRTLTAEGKNNKLRRDDQIGKVLKLIDQAGGRESIAMICIEKTVMHGAHMKGAEQLITLGECMADEIVARGIPLKRIPPSTLKKYFTGSGRAQKPEMIAEAIRRGFAVGEDDNKADAVALAILARDICRYRANDFTALVGLQKYHFDELEKHKGNPCNR